MPLTAGGMAGIGVLVMCSWLLLVSVSVSVSAADDDIVNAQQLARMKHQPRRRDGSITFLVVGDWGRKGTFNQSRVATSMGRIGQDLGIDFVISTGDNFYTDGLKGEHDPAFVESFTRVYTAKSLQTPWYTVLGNHDYRGDAGAQLSPVLRKLDTRWLCLRSFIVNAGMADIFFVDTTPFVQSYYTDRDHAYDWRGIGSPKDYIRNILTSLDLALKTSAATWKIVVGHHAIKSAGYHGDTTELLQQLLPILQANKVDFYVNGHDHCLQQIRDTKSKIQFFTSGAGSKAWRGDTKHLKRTDLNFFYDGQGFMSVQLGRNKLEIKFYDINGKVLHRWSTLKQLYFPM
ncbi:Purple acid phosphatase 8 [Dionaea muscipula]